AQVHAVVGGARLLAEADDRPAPGDVILGETLAQSVADHAVADHDQRSPRRCLVRARYHACLSPRSVPPLGNARNESDVTQPKTGARKTGGVAALAVWLVRASRRFGEQHAAPRAGRWRAFVGRMCAIAAIYPRGATPRPAHSEPDAVSVEDHT